MKQKTDINIIVDRSGSMRGIASDMLGGLRSFVQEEQEKKHDACVSFYLFDEHYETVFEGKDLKEVKDSDFVLPPRGWTAAIDAIGKTINSVGERLSKLPIEERPNRVLIITVTDGEDNWSKEFKLDQLREMIVHQREVYAWDFVFLGANIDAFGTSGSYGIGVNSTSQWTPDRAGITKSFASLNNNMRQYVKLDRNSDRKSTFTFEETVPKRRLYNYE